MKTDYLLKRKEALELCREVEHLNELKNRDEPLFYKTSSRRFEQLKKKYCEIPKDRKIIYKGYIEKQDEDIIRKATSKEIKKRDFYFYSRFPISKN